MWFLIKSTIFFVCIDLTQAGTGPQEQLGLKQPSAGQGSVHLELHTAKRSKTDEIVSNFYHVWDLNVNSHPDGLAPLNWLITINHCQPFKYNTWVEGSPSRDVAAAGWFLHHCWHCHWLVVRNIILMNKLHENIKKEDPTWTLSSRRSGSVSSQIAMSFWIHFFSFFLPHLFSFSVFSKLDIVNLKNWIHWLHLIWMNTWINFKLICITICKEAEDFINFWWYCRQRHFQNSNLSVSLNYYRVDIDHMAMRCHIFWRVHLTNSL